MAEEEENTSSVPSHEGQPPPEIDIQEFLTTMTESLGELSEALAGEHSESIVTELNKMLEEVSSMNTSEPAEFDANHDYSQDAPTPFHPTDKEQIKQDINDIKTQILEVKNLIDAGRQNLQQLEDVQNTFVPEFVDYIEILNNWAHEIARTKAGQGSAFNTEDLAHIFLAYEYIMAMKDLLLAILKEIINHFGELTEYEMICVALVPIAACATLIANILNMAAKTIGNAFKLTIIGAFINTHLDDTVEKFIKIAAQILKIIGCIAGICKFIIGQIDGEIGEFFSIIDRIFAYVFWALDCTTHATGVMAVEKVPKIPKPISGWDIIDPYDWNPGDVEPVIEPFVPPIVVGMTSPSPIVQGTNKTPMVQNYIAKEEYEVPKMEFLDGGTKFWDSVSAATAAKIMEKLDEFMSDPVFEAKYAEWFEHLKDLAEDAIEIPEELLKDFMNMASDLMGEIPSVDDLKNILKSGLKKKAGLG